MESSYFDYYVFKEEKPFVTFYKFLKIIFVSLSQELTTQLRLALNSQSSYLLSPEGQIIGSITKPAIKFFVVLVLESRASCVPGEGLYH